MATTGYTKNFVVKNGITTGFITLDANSGNITGTNLSVTGLSNLGAVGNVKISGGSNGFFLKTDGTGNLTFTSPASTQSPAPMPTYVPVGTDLSISANYQGLYSVPIVVDGSLTVDGVLVQVDGIVGSANTQIIFNNVGNTTGSPNLTFNTTTNTITTTVVKTTPVTVANLPLAATVGAGARAYVTNANTVTFLAVVGAGGSNSVPVVSNGTNWVVG